LNRNMEMRNPFTGAVVGLAVVLLFSSVATAQMAQSRPQQGTHEGSPWKYNPSDRAVGSGGPAPKRDLSGTWAGPRSGAGVPDFKRGDTPSLTPFGQQLMNENKPLTKFSPAGTNDPMVRTCDPLGVPRNAIDEIRGLSFATMPGRIVMLIQSQDIWREIWMDGRTLPANVGAAEKGAPDPRYNGYSVGHWEGDYTLVIDSTGLDERTWLNRDGYPHSVNAHVQERYTRVDYNNLELTVTVDDPKVYANHFSLGTAHFKWIPNQELDESLCLPSEVIEYLKALGDPAGSDPNAVGPPGK
jgi:hypothetical protein